MSSGRQRPSGAHCITFGDREPLSVHREPFLVRYRYNVHSCAALVRCDATAFNVFYVLQLFV